MHPRTYEVISSIPLLVDGSDGSLWAARADLSAAIADPVIAERLLVRVSDFLKAVELIEFLYATTVDSPTCGSVENPVAPPPDGDTVSP